MASRLTVKPASSGRVRVRSPDMESIFIRLGTFSSTPVKLAEAASKSSSFRLPVNVTSPEAVSTSRLLIVQFSNLAVPLALSISTSRMIMSRTVRSVEAVSSSRESQTQPRGTVTVRSLLPSPK